MDSEWTHFTTKAHLYPIVGTACHTRTLYVPIDFVKVELNDGMCGTRGNGVHLRRGLIDSGVPAKELGKARIHRKHTVGPSCNDAVLKVLERDFSLR